MGVELVKKLAKQVAPLLSGDDETENDTAQKLFDDSTLALLQRLKS